MCFIKYFKTTEIIMHFSLTWSGIVHRFSVIVLVLNSWSVSNLSFQNYIFAYLIVSATFKTFVSIKELYSLLISLLRTFIQIFYWGYSGLFQTLYCSFSSQETESEGIHLKIFWFYYCNSVLSCL